jgi:hypothetical protein
MSTPINFVPLQKYKDYNGAGTVKILLTIIILPGIIASENHLFYGKRWPLNYNMDVCYSEVLYEGCFLFFSPPACIIYGFACPRFNTGIC